MTNANLSAEKRRPPGAAKTSLVPTAATALVILPLLLRNPSTMEAFPGYWLAALFVTGPLAAFLAFRFFGCRLTFPKALLVGLPQLPLVVLLSTLAVWLDVQRGHLLAGSGSEAMSYGIGTIVSLVAGIVLMILVAAISWIGARTRN